MSEGNIVEVRNVTLAQDQNTVLSDVNFNVKKGEFIYLVGKTGSGKSSLLKSMYAELPLVSGEIHVADFDVHTIKNKEIPHLRRKMGIVFQDYQLLPDRTIFKNLEFVLKATGWKEKSDISKRIGEVLEKVGIEGKEHKKPHELSGGEQQRVGIARALLNDPELIVADEPTGNLDPETSNNILNLLIQISHNGRAVIMATHDYSMMSLYEARTLTCENGKLTEG